MLKNRLSSRRTPVAAVLLFPLVLAAQEAPAPPQNPNPTAPAPAAGRAPAPAAAARPTTGPKKYEDVITAKAKTKNGLFKVHSVDEKWYYEIPESLYRRDMLIYNEIAAAPPGIGYSGTPGTSRMIRWDRRGNRIFLRINPVTKRATDGDAAMKLAVELSNFQPILRTFNIEAEGPDKSAVIDVTPMFSTDIPELSAVSLLSGLRLPAAPQMDPSRSFIEEIKTFPENIEVRSTFTWNLGTPPLPPTSPQAPPPAQIPGNLRSLSVMVHYSMVLLPEKPMVGRLFDPRVGYFIQPFEEYANEENRVETKGFITRYRLEKKNPSAALSEPVKPIVFYISREVPDAWRGAVRKGIEDWNIAFEQAGFKNAIQAKDAPTKEQDPDWDAEDVRYSVIRWAALPVQNAMGPHVHDPRSGEIISAHIILWHDVLKLGQSWYFGMCSAQNDGARKLPFDNKLMGEILGYIATHEVGHTLGLRHNQKASSAYSIKQLRDPVFTKDHGSVASIMAYGRFNYVAQPEDGVTQLMPIVGPYDKFAIEWGYKPLPGKTPDDEKKALDEIAARQMTNPFLRFGGEDGPSQIDPTVKTENIGDDPVLATTLGYKNLERVINGWLVKATTKQGEDYDLLKDTFQGIWNLRRLWFGSVVKQVGGVVESRTLAGRGGEQFSRVPREKQKEAVKFLHEHVFMPPTNIIKPELLNQFQYFGAADVIISQQKAALETLLSPMRFKLLTDGEALDAKTAYPLREFLADVQGGVFSEVSKPTVSIDLYRRALQRNYLDHIKTLLGRPATPVPAGLVGNVPNEIIGMMTAGWQQTDFRGTARTMLEQLNQKLGSAIVTAKDPATLNHLKDCRKEIEMILDPKKG
ncbi:zinc-dependent metalloprotease [Bryobacter aggregatus]|uniref:zinc-dependent metalloprotease n=1 Tax=Bryobacter aggregatus TaxID=360054 RepID=UPI0004E2705A|nr:zinc-dependent metalloprotease [Bryobacter aggregatus]